MRYASDRKTAAFRSDRDAAEGVTGPPPMYRADLLRQARLGRRKTLTGSLENYGRGHEIEFRTLADLTKLSVGTIRQALDGNAAKLDSLWILANFFGIPWLELFDVEKRLQFDEKGRVDLAIKESARKARGK